jgi:hypothetical protein
MKTSLLLALAVTLFLPACRGEKGSGKNGAEKEHSELVARLGYDPDKPASATNQKPYYIVTSTLSKKRYSTKAYEVLPNGTVRFVHYETKREVVLSPPFEIEQRWMAAGH